ncbi:hypothetical protein CBM2625_B170250 [Cupriavidus taiwanensis]|nr:hypothetical protein CBM2625_B170250 [Cupriavidus taiwanensis]
MWALMPHVGWQGEFGMLNPKVSANCLREGAPALLPGYTREAGRWEQVVKDTEIRIE